MTTEYVVLGVLLIVMGGVQTYLRHGPGGKAIRAEQEELARRRLETVSPENRDAVLKANKRAGKAWSSWTAVVGGVSVVLGIILVIFGVLGY